MVSKYNPVHHRKSGRFSVLEYGTTKVPGYIFLHFLKLCSGQFTLNKLSQNILEYIFFSA